MLILLSTALVSLPSHSVITVPYYFPYLDPCHWPELDCLCILLPPLLDRAMKRTATKWQLTPVRPHRRFQSSYDNAI